MKTESCTPGFLCFLLYVVFNVLVNFDLTSALINDNFFIALIKKPPANVLPKKVKSLPTCKSLTLDVGSFCAPTG